MIRDFTDEEIQQWVAEIEKRAEYLASKGWIYTEETGYTYPDREFKNKLSSTDASVYQTCWDLKATGWVDVTVHQFTPILHGERHIDWGYYRHPVSKKIYSFLEAEEIFECFNNDDTDYVPCGKTELLQPLYNEVDNVYHIIYLGRDKDDDPDHLLYLLRNPADDPQYGNDADYNHCILTAIGLGLLDDSYRKLLL